MSEEGTVTGIPAGGAEKLKNYVSRIESLEEEKKGVSDEIKDVYDEAGATGFDKKVLRQVIRLRKQSKEKREEEDTIKDLYLHALGEI